MSVRGAWRVADLRSAENALMATLPAGALMQRAAAGLARRCGELLSDTFGGVYGRRVHLLVGAGNNGGDALYAGAMLARRGAAVTAGLLDPDRAHPGGLAALLAASGRVVPAPPPALDLVVDGILGIGGRGGLREPATHAVRRATGVDPAGNGNGGHGSGNGHGNGDNGNGGDGGGFRRPIVVAVDVPSGIDVDTGALPGESVTADVTVTFGALKPGLVVGPASRHAGLVELVDIGLGDWLRTDPAIRIPDAADIAECWPSPVAGDDKYTRGVVGVATGSSTFPGAALMSVSGALVGPVGMVRYAGSAADLIRAAHPSVVCADQVADAGRVQAWVCGSGLGTDSRAARELRAVLASSVPVCLDADALTMLADGSMASLLRGRDAPTVITPHDREFGRLAGGGEPGSDRVESALQLAAQMRAVVLLKGDRTVVATPGGAAYVNPTGTPALATGGTGDVLAGLLGALLAGGVRADRAAVAAAFLHGLAGRRAAADGPVTAVDVATALRPTIADLLQGGGDHRSPVPDSAPDVRYGAR